jgi:hypothetical protein
VSQENVISIPDDVCFEDAAFLPSIETALSLVMDARPMLGERVAVIGQGLIGTLVSLLLVTAMNADVTVVDTDQRRLAASARCNPLAKTWNGRHIDVSVDSLLDFDVAIEVSGHLGGLQTAIDATGSGGRIILGSLYGESIGNVKLGTRFHRSGISLRASQVSLIPPELRSRWTKERRFDLAWQLLKALQPSQLLKVPSVPLQGGGGLQGVYERLDGMEDLTIFLRPSK